jgi:hypothetical protein
MDLRKLGCEPYFLQQDRYQYQAVVNMGTNVGVPYKEGKFLTS